MEKRWIIGTVAVAAMALVIPSALGAGTPARAAAYVNPDTGAATENGNVDPKSDCDAPDRRDRQRLSSGGGSERNVHVDACLFDSVGETSDGVVTFASRGVGAISACPDPDQAVAQAPQIMNGPKVAFVHDHDADGRNEHCHQSGYQMKDAAGDEEYHVRLNNDAAPGRQRVVFCFDPQQDAAADVSGQPSGHGCGDAETKSRVIIRWVR